MDGLSYDDRQLANVWRACAACGRVWWMPPQHQTCVECDPGRWQRLNPPAQRKVDVGGNAIYGDP